MAPTPRQRVESLYHAARERAPEEREAFLREAADGDDDLYREVKSLLERSGAGVLGRPASQILDESAPKPGARLGPYQIIEAIGAGGMGTVYKARDTRLDRSVAIKISSERFSDRFDHEARAIAAL